MEITPDDLAGAVALNDVVTRYIATHESEVTDTLHRVSTGELDMVETLSDTEKDIARRLFAWMVEVGPANAWAVLGAAATAAASLLVDDEGHGVSPAFLVEAALRAARDAYMALDPEFGTRPPFSDIEGILREASEGYERHGLLGLALIMVSYIFYESFHYPQPETGVYDIADNTFDKVKWVYRYWYNQLEVAERGSGLEAFFRAQILGNPFGIDDSAIGPVQRLSLSCAGDLLAVDRLTEANTAHLFDDIVDFYSSADIVSANLESTVYEGAIPGRDEDPGKPYRMNTSRAMFDKFRDEAGINYFSTATNHANDWGTEGLLGTLDVLRESGAYHSGTADSEEQQEGVVVVEQNGIKVALLSYTFDLNGRAVPADMPYLVNEVRFNDVNPAPDYSLIQRQITAARDKGAEFIVAYCHWGWEFEMYPHVNITEAAHDIVALGVDVILGNHPHVSQPAQVIERGSGQPNALVFYAFGDFVSYHPQSRNSKLAYAVKFDIAKVQTASRTYVSWDHLDALPMYIVNAHLGGDSYDCRIVKFESVLADPDDYGLTDWEKSELPHLRDVVWDQILSPLSHIPAGGWSD